MLHVHCRKIITKHQEFDGAMLHTELKPIHLWGNKNRHWICIVTSLHISCVSWADHAFGALKLLSF